MDWTAFKDAARRGMKAGAPLQNPLALLRLGVAMLIASIVGYLLGDMEHQLILTVGAFMAIIAVVMPHNRSRLVAATATSIAQIVAVALGLAAAGNWAIVLPAIFVLFFLSGLLRAVSLGLAMRATVVTIVFLAIAEMSNHLSMSFGEVVGYFSIGVAITLVCQLLPPFGTRHSAQQRAVAAFYRAAADEQGQDVALLAADRSLALVRTRRHDRLDRLRALVESGEAIAQLRRALNNRPPETVEPWMTASSDQLRRIADAVSRRTSVGPVPAAPWPSDPADDLERALMSTVDEATRIASGGTIPDLSGERETPGPVELVRAEFRPGSPVLRHAIRLAVVCVVAQAVGLLLSRWLGPDLWMPGHSFWVVIAAALIVFPDYGVTFARGIGRTIGTIAGAAFGIALSFLPYQPLLHTVVLLLLFWGYLVFRSCGQPYTMFWVVAWIAALEPGTLGATTRGLGTVVGCLLAFAAYLLFPTWHRALLSERLNEWRSSVADQLDRLRTRWDDDTEDHRLDVARAAVTARLTRIEFAETASAALVEPADKHGRWTNDSIPPTVEAVQQVARQIAALTALAPMWSPADRIAAGRMITETAQRLTDIDAAPVDTTTRVASTDTAAALTELERSASSVRELEAANA